MKQAYEDFENDIEWQTYNKILEGTKDVLEEKENGKDGNSNENNNTYAM